MTRLKKRKMKQRVYSWPVVAILFIVAFFFAVNTWDVYKKYSISRQNIAGLAEHRVSAQEREKELQQKIAYLRSERGLEEEIREKFNVAKDGEEVVIVLDPKVEIPMKAQESEGLLQKMWSTMWGVFQ